MSNLTQQICQRLGVEASEDNCLKIENLLAQQFPKCNRCAKVISDVDSRWGGPLTFSTNWGYESTGKDTNRDSWILCTECKTQALAQWSLICTSCRKSIPEVMAELDHRNPHNSYYGDYQSALKRYLDPKTVHCGLEYALIEDRILCEICYEKFVTGFKIPLQAGGYHIWEGTPDSREGLQIEEPNPEAQYPGRLGQCFKPRSYDNEIEVDLAWEELVAVRTGPLREKAFVSVSYQPDKEEIAESLKRKGHAWEPTVCLKRGDTTYYHVLVSWLKANVRCSDFAPEFEVTKLRLTDQGQKVWFGNTWISAQEIIEKSPETPSWLKSGD